MSERLTALDATFLELEEADDSAHMHIGAVMIFEPLPEGRAPSPAHARRDLESRLRPMPRYWQRLSSTRTGGLSWPRWEEQSDLDLGAHMRRARLPGRGTDADLLEWAAQFFSERLDRSRPLWELVMIDGLSGGRWALASKTHHCMVDGVGSIDAAYVLLDTERHPPRRRPAKAAVTTASEREGNLWAESLLDLPFRAVAGGARLVAGAANAALHPSRARDAMRRSRALAELIVRDEVIAAPRTSLNVAIGGKRRLGVLAVPLEQLKAIKRRLGGTVNDVVLAVCAGGLRRLLEARGEEPPPQGLRAMVPVNLRTASQRLTMGNRITSLFVHLPVAERDPIRRYELQMEEAESLKSGTQALGSSAIIDLAGHAPPLVHTFLARSLYATRLFNVTITNVPGPQIPLYAFGSKMLAVWPLVPLAAEHAVGIAAMSYDGQVFFTVNADYDAVPDLDTLIAGINESIAELSG